jgi:hypothetical protein
MLDYPVPNHTPCHRLGLRTNPLRIRHVQQILLLLVQDVELEAVLT